MSAGCSLMSSKGRQSTLYWGLLPLALPANSFIRVNCSLTKSDVSWCHSREIISECLTSEFKTPGFHWWVESLTYLSMVGWSPSFVPYLIVFCVLLILSCFPDQLFFFLLDFFGLCPFFLFSLKYLMLLYSMFLFVGNFFACRYTRTLVATCTLVVIRVC